MNKIDPDDSNCAYSYGDGEIIFVAGSGEAVSAFSNDDTGKGFPDGLPEIRDGSGGRCP